MLHQLTSVAPQGKSATWILQQPDSLLGKLLRTVRYQQVFVWAKPLLAVKPLKLSVPPVLFVSVTLCAALVLPTGVLPKVRLAGEKVTAG